MNFSVIIPIKNNYRQLKKAIESIPNRSDLQLIVVDDNSSSDRIDESIIALGHNREFLFDFIRLENSVGAGGARNVGLSAAIGDWVIFCDADDFFTEHFDSLLMDFQGSDADLVYFKVSSVFSISGVSAKRGDLANSLIDDFIDGKPNSTNRLRYFYTTPWGKLIKRTILLRYDILFEEVCAGNDLLFSVKAAFHADSILVDQRKCYCATVTEGSIMNTRAFRNDFSRFKAVCRLNDFIKTNRIVGCQRSVLYLTIRCLGYGMKNSIEVIRYIIHHRINPFIGTQYRFRTVFSKHGS